LNQISLSINKGDVIGIIGASGAGKSTFFDIITGLLVPSHGKFLIDELELQTCSQRMAWMTKLGYVPQTPYIFDGTIAENIAFEMDRKNIDTNQVLKCCHMAAMDDFLDDFLDELPLGIESYIGERGVRLSGGQRQRVSIARALYQQPELLIFDEATSALDNTNEKAIQNTIYSLRGKQTMIIVAHRLTTVASCDIIYEFDQGELKRWGRPEDVLE
jgi:ABC-type bacteriocin/lantibiotic exporter with double-glycine peptidase domain